MAEGEEERMSFSALRKFHSQKIKEQIQPSNGPLMVPRQVYHFEDSTKTLLKQMRTKENEISSEDIGKDLKNVRMLIDVHSDIEKEVVLLEQRVSGHLEEADHLMLKFPKSKDHIADQRKNFSLALQSLTQKAKTRSKKLQESEQLHVLNGNHRKLSSWIGSKITHYDGKNCNKEEKEKLKRELEEKIKDMEKYRKKATALVKNLHPSSKEIDANVKRLSQQWIRLEEIVESLSNGNGDERSISHTTKEEAKPVVQINHDGKVEMLPDVHLKAQHKAKSKVNTKLPFTGSPNQENGMAKQNHDTEITNRLSKDAPEHSTSKEEPKVKPRVKMVITKPSKTESEDLVSNYKVNNDTSSVQNHVREKTLLQGREGTQPGYHHIIDHSPIEEYEVAKPNNEVKMMNRLSKETQEQTTSNEETNVKPRIKKVIRKVPRKEYENLMSNDNDGNDLSGVQNHVRKDDLLRDCEGASTVYDQAMDNSLIQEKEVAKPNNEAKWMNRLSKDTQDQTVSYEEIKVKPRVKQVIRKGSTKQSEYLMANGNQSSVQNHVGEGDLIQVCEAAPPMYSKTMDNSPIEGDEVTKPSNGAKMMDRLSQNTPEETASHENTKMKHRAKEVIRKGSRKDREDLMSNYKDSNIPSSVRNHVGEGGILKDCEGSKPVYRHAKDNLKSNVKSKDYELPKPALSIHHSDFPFKDNDKLKPAYVKEPSLPTHMNDKNTFFDKSLVCSSEVVKTDSSVKRAACSVPKPQPRQRRSNPLKVPANDTNDSDVHFSSDFMEEMKIDVLEIASNRITIQWPAKQLGQKESYFICYRNLKSGDWTQSKVYWKGIRGTVEGLEPETSYQFKVKIWDQGSGDESSHTGLSEIVVTPQSPLLRLKQMCGNDGLLPLQEIKSERNSKDKIRKFVLSDSNYIPSADEKTILLLGCTGCGKSTLIDSFANYLVGAQREGFHFKMVRLEKCEEDNAKDKTQSLTEWITSYVIVPSKATEDRLGFTINIVDTPGFCDTRGHDRDIEVIEQITTFFERKEKLRKSLEAICFIFKASDTRLTPSQRYVCDTIMGLFGKDIKPNICILTTFSDVKPKVLELLKKVDIPCDTYFEFNNVGKQETSCSGPKSKLHTQFLEMNNESFKLFLNHVSILPSQNLKLTLDVLDIRKKIECITDHLDDSIQRALSDIRVFQQEIKVFEEHKSQIEKKKDFSYQVDAYVVEEKPIDTEVEYQATNCRHCKHTCHRNCSKLRHKLRSCSAFDENGHCEVCPNSCHYKTHYKSSTYFERKSKTVKKQFREYYASNRPYQEIIEDLQDKIDKYEQTITKQSNLLAALNNELQDTALRPLPTDTNAYFDEMIADLNRVQKPGYKELIAVIQKCRDRMKVDRNVMEFKVKLEKAKKDLQDAVGKKDALSRIRKITSYLVKPFKSLFR